MGLLPHEQIRGGTGRSALLGTLPSLFPVMLGDTQLTLWHGALGKVMPCNNPMAVGDGCLRTRLLPGFI